MHDVMAFTAVYHLKPETVMGIFSLEWDWPLTILLQRDNPSGNGWNDHLHQYQRGREAFLAGRYEGMLVIEDDILPPPDTLKRLAKLVEQGADLAYGVYMFRGKVVNVLEKYKKPARNMGESLSVRGLYRAAVKQGIVDCSGSGLGCVLITRKVLEAIPFNAPKDPGYCDWDWTERVYRAGFVMRADMAIRAGHAIGEGGAAVYPPG